MPVSNDFQTFLTFAEAYSALGYSVIPLLGDQDPERPKTPAVAWASFQHQTSTPYDHRQWFSETGFGGIGIITGHISKLVVLDFDSEAVFKDFRTRYPDLVDTHTVRSATRQLPHLYFKLPDYLHLESMKGQGIDVLSNGRYVVAPPTSINGQAYKIVRGGMPKSLTERDISRIQSFLNTYKLYRHEATPQAHGPDIKHTNASQPVIKPSENDLQRLYRHLCQQGSRNEALFRTSLYSRNTGWSMEETKQSLVQLHSKQKGSHPKESQVQRQREALATISSAFSRPANTVNSKSSPQGRGYLPNSVREALLQHKMTYLIRTLEGLAISGIQEGQQFSTQEAEKILKVLVGRDSIHKALKSMVHDQSIFERVFPVNPFQTANAVARSKSQLNNKQCSLLPEKNQEKLKGGRRKHYYKMPSMNNLCRILKVDLTTSDPLERTDLSSAHQTRMAIHRKLIERRPGQYTRKWLANRLGVTKPTINRYNRLIPIHSRPVYTETIINWNNIERLPFDEPLQGAFLQTIHGKKYPALRVIASMLLTKGTHVCLKEQGGNYYWIGNTESLFFFNRKIVTEEVTVLVLQANLNYMLEQKGLDSKQLSSHKFTQTKEAKLQKQNFRKPLKDCQQEILAQQLYTILNTQTSKQLSIVNARHIAFVKSEKQVRAALSLLKQRKSVKNPTAFIMSILF